MMLNVGVSFLRSALIGGILASAWLSGARAEGGPPISGGVRYAIGVVEVVESTERLDFFSRSNRLGAVRIRPGGAMMPEVDVSDSGVLSIGRKRIDVRNGALLHSPKPSACEARLSKARESGHRHVVGAQNRSRWPCAVDEQPNLRAPNLQGAVARAHFRGLVGSLC